MSGILTVSLLANAFLLLTVITVLPTTPPAGDRWVEETDDVAATTEPVCTCLITDPVKRSTAFTVAHFNHEPHAVDCPRRGMIKKD